MNLVFFLDPLNLIPLKGDKFHVPEYKNNVAHLQLVKSMGKDIANASLHCC